MSAPLFMLTPGFSSREHPAPATGVPSSGEAQPPGPMRLPPPSPLNSSSSKAMEWVQVRSR
jgi:hypothetical protein